MEWKLSNRTDQGLLNIPKRWLHIHYYEALNILFRFENSLRVFVYSVLKNEYLNEWKNCSLSIGEGDPKTINSIANQRIRQADSYGYLGYDITAPLMHLTSGELVELMVSEAYWLKFKKYFRGNKEIIKNKLLEIGNIRNSLAHFRPIKEEDVGLVKQNSRHTLIGIEECLSNVFSQYIRVPTNTQEEWYKAISKLGTESTSTTLYFSKDEEWICVLLNFISPVLEKRQYSETFFSFLHAKINTPNMLTERLELAKYITYASEKVGYPTINKKMDMEIEKEVRLVFRKDVLLKNQEIIVSEMREVLSTINDECDLLLQDNLARGKMVESASTTAWYATPENGEGKWNYIYDSLEEKYQPKHPDEYWGQLAGSTDVVAGCYRYPWMPADISSVEGWMD